MINKLAVRIGVTFMGAMILYGILSIAVLENEQIATRKLDVRIKDGQDIILKSLKPGQVANIRVEWRFQTIDYPYRQWWRELVLSNVMSYNFVWRASEAIFAPARIIANWVFNDGVIWKEELISISPYDNETEGGLFKRILDKADMTIISR